MKVVLKVTVFDRIREDMNKARQENRAADYVVVTDEEYVELRADGRAQQHHTYPCFDQTYVGSGLGTLETKTFPKRGGSHFERPIVTYSRENIFGLKLYVVPKEYHPA